MKRYDLGFTSLELRQCELSFDMFDLNRDGYICEQDILGIIGHLTPRIHRTLSTYGGKITFESFLDIILVAKESLSDSLMRAFDADRHETVTPQDIKIAATRSGVHVTDEEAQAMFEYADGNSSGKLTMADILLLDFELLIGI